MPLTIHNTALSSSSESISLQLLSHPSLSAAADVFLSRSSTPVPSTSKSICVLEGEQALIDTVLEPKDVTLGSQDATTCIIVICHCPKTGLVWAAHQDRSNRSDESSLSVLARMQEPQLYLAGSFCEPTGESELVCEAVLLKLNSSPVQVEVRLACILDKNTAEDGSPRTRQLVFSPYTGEARPACFEDRGPDLPRRMAYISRRMESGQLIRVYEARLCGYLLPKFDAKVPSWQVFNAERFLELADEDFLEKISTSPEFEPAHFVSDWKSMFQWTIKAQDADFVVKDVFYVYDGGKWKAGPMPGAPGASITRVDGGSAALIDAIRLTSAGDVVKETVPEEAVLAFAGAGV